MPINPLYSVCLPAVSIADDAAETAASLRLSHAGMRAWSAQSEPQCLDLALRKPVSIILIDIVMSEMSGIETRAALRAHNPPYDSSPFCFSPRETILPLAQLATQHL